MADSAEVQKRLQALSDDYQKLQGDLQGAVSARQKLEAQEQENKGVQKEFASLADSATIYKLVGPILLKQDRMEANLAVEGRLEFIGKEMYEYMHSVGPDDSAMCKRFEGQIKDIQEKSEDKKMEIYSIQSQMQSLQGEQAQAGA